MKKKANFLKIHPNLIKKNKIQSFLFTFTQIQIQIPIPDSILIQH